MPFEVLASVGACEPIFSSLDSPPKIYWRDLGFVISEVDAVWANAESDESIYSRLVAVRKKFGIQTLASLREAKRVERGSIVLFVPKNCNVCMTLAMLLNTMQIGAGKWQILNYDFTKDWMSDDATAFQLVVFGKRTMRFALSPSQSVEWLGEKILEAVNLSESSGHDLVWNASTALLGSWQKSSGNYNVQMVQDTDFEAFRREEETLAHINSLDSWRSKMMMPTGKKP